MADGNLMVTPVDPPLPEAWPHLVLLTLAGLLVAMSLAYGFGMVLASRREPRPVRFPLWGGASNTWPVRSRPDLFFIFVLPCLNEDRVIRAGVERLLALADLDHAILVIDDGSDDDTAAEVEPLLGERVWLLRRRLPHARQGKGEALNAAIAQLVVSPQLAGRNPDDVIVVVVDADGRLDPHAVAQVAPFFADPSVGGVQTGVRINNRQHSLLARMQDMEFVIHTQVFQRGRRHLGSVGLGGNGQFMRLSALLSLGTAPWSRSLTEDLDLGVRLLTQGWRTEFCSTADVHQQGLTDLRRLVRQRTRWFQGHLQSWWLIPQVLRGASTKARADLLYHLSSPVLLLMTSLLTASFVVWGIAAVWAAVHGHNPLSPWMVSTYLLTFGPATVFGQVYRSHERTAGLTRRQAWALSHLYVVYGLLWYLAGWRAVGRTVLGRTGWAKTARLVEADGAPVVRATASVGG